MSTQTTANSWLTFANASKYAGVSRATIYRWTEHYNLHYTKIGRISRISTRDIDAFMTSPQFRI